MIFDYLKDVLSGEIMDLKPAPIPTEPVDFEMVTLDRTEKDNSKWLSYITAALAGAKTFEIHCWNEEHEWIELALRYGKRKDDLQNERRDSNRSNRKRGGKRPD